MRLGIIGAGAMGSAMARRAIEDGLEVVVYDVSSAATAALAECGARAAATPRALCEGVDMVAIVVLNDDQVRTVVCGEDGILEAEQGARDVAVHSTIHLSTLYEVALRARERGFTLFDAGVSGSTGGAERGQLAVMVGCEEETLLRCRPVLETYGGLVLRMGPLGAGMKAKVARNLIGFVQCTAVYEGMRLAEQADVDLGALSDIVRHSEAQGQLVNFFLSRSTVAPSRDDEQGRQWLAIAEPNVEIARKDLGAALALAKDLGIRLPASEEALRLQPAVWGVEPGELV